MSPLPVSSMDVREPSRSAERSTSESRFAGERESLASEIAPRAFWISSRQVRASTEETFTIACLEIRIDLLQPASDLLECKLDIEFG